MIVELNIQTKFKEELVDITALVNKELLNAAISEGELLLFVPHTTAGITINENADPDVINDILLGFNSIGLNKCSFRHSEGNSIAHIKSSLVGFSLKLIVHKNCLLLGRWQGVYFCEFDGPRKRKLILKIN